MVNNLTFMAFFALLGFMLIFGGMVDNRYAMEDEKHQTSFGDFVDEKVAKYHRPAIKKGKTHIMVATDDRDWLTQLTEAKQ